MNDSTTRIQFQFGQAKGRLAQHLRANEDAEAIRDLPEPLASQGHTLRYIAEWLNRRRVVGPQGGIWYPTSVARALDRLGLSRRKAA